MLHIDEHIIELYILNAAETASRRGEIEAHLRECHGCRSMADEMRIFHEKLGEEVATTSSDERATVTSLMRFEAGLTPFFERIGSPVPYRASTITGKFRHFARKHPIKTTIGSFGLAAVMAIAGMFVTPLITKDTNPSYIFPNTTSDRLEVCNRQGDILWKLPVMDLRKEVEKMTTFGIPRMVIYDLDGDGENEVVTTYKFPSDTTDLQKLRILDGDMKSIREIGFTRSFKYQDRTYTPFFNPSSLTIQPTGPNNSPEIYVSAGNVGRSPSFLTRLTNRGEIVGEYWHFGSFMIHPIRNDKEGQLSLLLTGVNDQDDLIKPNFPFVALLDPKKIIGTSSSSATPGFIIPRTNSEIWYLRFPHSSIDNALMIPPGSSDLETAGANLLQFKIPSSASNQLTYRFYYFFDFDMNVLDVKPDNTTEQVYAELVRKGTLSGKIDEKYLNNLKQNVQYWNGNKWGNEIAKVRQIAGNP